MLTKRKEIRKNREVYMNQNTTFVYSYSAKENKEIQEIRKKYLPKSESTLDELKRLDGMVQSSGTVPALIVGIIGCLIILIYLCSACGLLKHISLNGVYISCVAGTFVIWGGWIFNKIKAWRKQK